MPPKPGAAQERTAISSIVERTPSGDTKSNDFSTFQDMNTSSGHDLVNPHCYLPKPFRRYQPLYGTARFTDRDSFLSHNHIPQSNEMADNNNNNGRGQNPHGNTQQPLQYPRPITGFPMMWKCVCLFPLFSHYQKNHRRALPEQLSSMLTTS